MQTHRYDDALDVLGRAVARFPDDWPVRLELARCLLEVDRPDAALVEAEQALVRAPDAERPTPSTRRAWRSRGRPPPR
jgi:predicted Zn-dependent protease